ncbi:TPM domain-containing protein [Mycobacterium sp. ML4]
MRIARLFGVVLMTLITGLLLATPAGAQPPSKLTDHITDTTGALTGPDRATVSAAIDRLYRDRHLQLWVVYVDNFNKFKPDNWANQTRVASGMGDQDVLLAVATNTKLYAFSVAPQALSADELSTLRTKQIEPAVTAKDWSRAAVAAADGLDTPSPAKRNWLPIAVGAAVAVLVVVLIVVLYRRRRRRAGHEQLGVDWRSSGQALATADARLRQITDYVARHRASIGTEAQTRLEEAKRHLAAAQRRQSSNEQDAVAHANRASTLAAEAQTRANADVQAAHRKR